jgi:outer membrane usher protein
MYRWLTTLSSILLLQNFVVSGVKATDIGSPPELTDAESQLTVDPSDALSSIGATDLYLGVTLNGSDRGIAHFGLLNGTLWASDATLRQIGMTLPAGAPDPVRLSSIKGVTIDYDQETQAVSITVPLALLRSPKQILDRADAEVTQASASPGIVLDYNLFGTQSTQGFSSLSAFTDFRAFDNLGVFESTALSQTGYGATTGPDRVVQLDTSWTSSFPDRLLTVRIGDTLTASTSWSRSTRIAGIQIGSNFGLQPYLVTTPLAQFVGSATLPSQVQLYVDGLQRYSGVVAPGQFQLNPVAGISGAGTADLVLTDALGRVSNYEFSLYSSPQLLRKGLTDWSVELGAVRENYGLESFDYGSQPIASETWEYGVTNGFTAESHAEATYGLVDVGIGGDVLLGSAGGILSGSIAYSSNHGAGGSQFGLGYSWSNTLFNISFNGLYSTPEYSDIATLYGPPPPTLTLTAAGGVNVGPLGNIGANYVELQQPDQPTSQFVGAYWYKSITPAISLNLNANQNLDQAGSRSIFLTLDVALDDRTYVSADAGNDGTSNTFGLNATRSIPLSGGFGWQAQQQFGGNGTNGLGELDYLGRYGQVDAGASDVNGNDAAYAGATGALVLLGGNTFASRNIADSFAVVSTDGVANIPVKLDNTLIGKTNSGGTLLVTPLNAYQNNDISIDPTNLPADMNISRVNQTATPSDRAGTLVQFGISVIRAASIILVDAARKPLPLGSQVTLEGSSGEPTLVGFDGVAYLDTLTLHNVLDVDTPSGPCHASFDYLYKGNSIPQIGPLVCVR